MSPIKMNLTTARLRNHALLLLLSTGISISCCSLANATNYYVSGSGNDTNNGLSTSTAFRTIQKAVYQTHPGDTVFVMNGTYTNTSPTGNVVTVLNSGTPSAWITYKAYPGHSPKLQFNGWSGFNLTGVSYIEINGFDIEGNNNNVTLNYALTQINNLLPSTSGTGIFGTSNNNTQLTHHIRVVNNKVHDCGGAGIAFVHSDYITVTQNTLYQNSFYSPAENSGISLFQSANYDNNTGYKMFVTNNASYSNENYVPNSSGQITDGNGIIIDDSKNTQNGSTFGAYNGRTLVANNVVFDNGGSGIHTFYSEHVDVINNTAYMNMQSPQINSGQIFATSSDDVRILNNIIYATPGKLATSNWNNSNVTYDYNIYFNGTDTQLLGPHDLQADPKFIAPSGANLNFHLQSNSPAINSGTSNLAPSYDYDWKSRPSCGGYDRGAYEFTGCK